jgi:hypothetical protein
MLKIILLFSVSLSLFGKEIYQSGSGTAESKTEACRIALENAQKEALYQSGINIFSVYEKRETVSDEEIKKIINYNLQSSYGFVETVSKSEKFDFNFRTGYITCKVDGKFDVDTSKLKSQLSALSQKYENISNEESERAEKLAQKNRLLQKYQNLKDDLSSENSFYINDSYRCGESLGISQCKSELRGKISKTFQSKLANKYGVDSYLIKIGDLDLDSKIETTVRGTLIASYNGRVSGRATSVRNPYLDEINSLNAYLGERQIFESEEEDNSPSWYDGLGTSVWNGTKTVLGFPFRKGNRVLINRYWGEPTFLDEDRDTEYAVFDYMGSSWNCGEYPGWKTCEIDEDFRHVDYLFRVWTFEERKDRFAGLFLKYGKGKAKVKNIKKGFDGYEDGDQEGFHNDYSYDFDIYGVALSVANDLDMRGWGFAITVGADYITPYNFDGYTQKIEYIESRYDYEVYEKEKIPFKRDPFWNYYATFDWVLVEHFLAGVGLTISEDDPWSFNYLNYHIGYMF